MERRGGVLKRSDNEGHIMCRIFQDIAIWWKRMTRSEEEPKHDGLIAAFETFTMTMIRTQSTTAKKKERAKATRETKLSSKNNTADESPLDEGRVEPLHAMAESGDLALNCISHETFTFVGIKHCPFDYRRLE